MSDALAAGRYLHGAGSPSITEALLARGIRYGGDYNPEQWPPEVWDEDVRLMAEAGVNLVTVGVFSWAMLEPVEGRYDFAWLRAVLDKLAAAGIGADLATPTASPPPWFAARYPGSRPVDETGSRYGYGGRQHVCVCSADYLGAAVRIVEQLVAEVGAHSAIEMWHVHNEYANEVPYCYCDNHAAAFRAWLEERYGTVARMNDAWGATFWGQRYSSFEEVTPPRRAAATVNPAQQLDYRRFTSAAYLEAMRREIAVLRRARPDVPVTTNFMGLYKPLDYFAWAAELDVVSTDNYQDPGDPGYPMNSAMHFDLVRSLNKTAPWLVMEQAASRVNWRERNVPKLPGAMRALSYQAVGRGAAGVLFFQWRASRSGSEKFHSAMLGHSGTRTPSWQEVTGLGEELGHLGTLRARTRAEVAICLSWPSWWALEGPGQPAHDLRLVDQLRWVYEPLFSAGLTVDFCRPDEDLSRYRLVVAPSLHLVEEAEATNLSGYVRGGGALVVSFWSGIVDGDDRVYLGPYGGPLRELFGGDVLDVAPLRPGQTLAVDWSDGSRHSVSFWTDLIERTDATVLARLAEGPHTGRPLVLSNQIGAGRCLYVGGRLDGAAMGRLYREILDLDMAQLAPGLEHVVREGSEGVLDFYINHSQVPVSVVAGPGSVEVLSGLAPAGQLELPPQGVAIIRTPPP